MCHLPFLREAQQPTAPTVHRSAHVPRGVKSALTAVMKLLGSDGSSCSLWKRTEDEEEEEEGADEERKDEGSPLE